MAKYDKVAGGSYGVYKKRPENPVPWGGIIILGVIILMIASCAT